MSDRALSIGTLVPKTTQQELVRDRLQNTTFVGIDFGTSTTVASYAVPGDADTPIQAEPIPIPQKRADGSTFEHHLVPSVVAWHRDELFVGAGARELKENNQVTEGRSVWSSFKMGLGVDLGRQFHQSVLKRGEEDVVIETPTQAAGVFLTYLRERIEAFVERTGLPSDLKYSISIPASFEPNQRADLMKALEMAGIDLPEQAFIDEPNAAFLNFLTEANMYGESRPLQVPSEVPLRILVFDFGAGTCDISILEVGEDPDGFYSKNLAISRFEVLGGDNIDRQVVREALVPQLCEASGVDEDELRETQVEKRLVPALKSHAERLKIAASKRVMSEKVGRHLPSIATDPETSVEFDADIEVRLPRETLRADTLSLSLGTFNDIMEPFLDDAGGGGRHDDEVSIFEPIHSAVRKSGLREPDLDLVLLVGGSSKNPYVQSALQDHFDQHAVEVEVPRDLRAHVSTGASINSLLLNGFGLSIVKPITSEPVFAIVRDGSSDSLYTLVEASTEIPSPPTSIDDLQVGRDGQESVQIPICVGSRDKVMATLEVQAPTEQGFEKGTQVHLDLRITRDKLLRARATVGSEMADTEIVRPFANREMTREERKIRQAEKVANDRMAQQGGRASIPVLLDLAQTCAEQGNPRRAAEIMEQVQMIDSSQGLQNRIAVQFARADRYDLAYEWAKKDYRTSETATSAYNVAVLSLRHKNDIDAYVEHLETALEIQESYVPALVSLGSHLHQKDEERGTQLLEKAFDLLQRRRAQDVIDESGLRQLKRVAEKLNRHDVAQAVEEEISVQSAAENGGKLYDENRLAQRARPDSLPERRE